jgi:hypothetical protein
MDDTLALLLNGYAWLPARLRQVGRPLQTHLAGQRAVGISGPEAVRFFYDEGHVRRSTALPEPVQGTLFGKDAVHTLDGDEHRHRKAMFLSLARRTCARIRFRSGFLWWRSSRPPAGWTRCCGVPEPLPDNLPAAVLVALHQEPERVSELARILGRRTRLTVEVAQTDMEMRPGVVLVVPPGRHLLVTSQARIGLIETGALPPARPSGDLLLATLA